MELRGATEVSLRDSQKGRLHCILLLPFHTAFLWVRGAGLQIFQKRLHHTFTPLDLEERHFLGFRGTWVVQEIWERFGRADINI